MTKFKLHYAPIDLKGDIPLLEFINYETFAFSTFNIYNENCVYLISVFDEVFVSDEISKVLSFLMVFTDEEVDLEEIEVFFQEYESYEDAYKSALDMMEIKKLCYN